MLRLRNLPDAVAAALRRPDTGEEDKLRIQLRQALEQHKGNVSATAREMGKARVQIRRWCKRFGLDPANFR